MSLGLGRLDWALDGRAWPNRAASRFLRAGGISWHVQVAGSGPVLLALHGAGAASHSWAGLLPGLAERFTVVAPDLPGHGFSGPAEGAALPLDRAAEAAAALVGALGLRPALGLGHSAGAAILARMALDGAPLAGIAAVNGALLPFRGLSGLVLPAMAKLMHWNPLTAPALATAAIDPNAVPGMIRSTGSRPPPESLAIYRRLFRAPSHLAGTLAMIAHWDLEPLGQALPDLRAPLLLMTGSRDRAVPPRQATEIRARAGGGEILRLERLGHLAHEEAPERVLGPILDFADGLDL